MRVFSPSPDFAPLAEVTNYKRIQIMRRLVGRSVIQVALPIEAVIVSYMQKNCWIVAEDGEPFIIRNITQTEQAVTVYGYGGHFGFEGRVTIPAAGMYAIEKTGSPDAVVKEFITKSTPAGNRSLNMVCEATQGGASISDQSRYKNLGDEVARVLAGAGRGERFRIMGSSITFDTYAGTNRSASCVFDLKYKNVKDFTYTLDATKTQSTPIVGGAGEGADREMYTTGDDAAGWDRREVFIDARDVESGDLEKLTQRAAQALIGDDQQVKADVAASANLIFGVDYFLGDIVTVNVQVKTYESIRGFFNPGTVTVPLVVRITDATETIDNGVRTVDLTFGSTIQQSDTVKTRAAVQQLQSTESNLDVILDKVYPVGSIYISVTATNPGALFGGTWAVFGAGKALVGYASGDADFGTIGATPGVKTVTLGTAQIPAHTHAQDPHTHVQNPHTHGPGTLGGYYKTRNNDDTGTAVWGGLAYAYSAFDTNAAAGSVVINAGTTESVAAINQAATAVNKDNTGGGGSHNNIQPSIVVYMWKRAA